MEYVCVAEGCEKKNISERVAQYSADKYGCTLCYDHQKTVGAEILAKQGPVKQPNETPEAEAVEDGPRTKVLKDELPPGSIMNLQGKEYITHQGLLAMAHRAGVIAIETTLVECSWDKMRAIVQAKVALPSKTPDGKLRIFAGYGDASGNPEKQGERQAEKTLKSGMEGAFIRMAETRAINRALRLATNIGMTSIDEMPEQG